ncbi:hypothetical protein BTO06_00350 [Tenacibaculum sp. SZ-18]|uniref:hypothetical protein n=1 Tax=Tenacibaculum sp. SZ-18 TaxID=754423 RepID=UPI000C2D66C2|nr:hypothetical protein [Tenacibaculum sp. SZ-18]AUC13687.1 hypothetical protein BTO06_00350 [Tenacibaculum sp. SZ-18]
MAIRVARIIDDLGTPIPDVHLVNTTTRQGAFTNFDGEFKIEASDNDIIEISHIGQSGKKLKGSELTGTITLLSSDEFLDEIVITSKKKKNGLFALGIIGLITGGIYLVSRNNNVEKVTL